MGRYLTYNPESGEIIGRFVLSLADDIEYNTPEDAEWVEAWGDPGQHYVQTQIVPGEGEEPDVETALVVDRPAIEFRFSGGLSPLVLGFDDLPEGSVVTATNALGEAVSSGDPEDPVELEGAGTFVVRVVPPFPWLPFEQTLEVISA